MKLVTKEQDNFKIFQIEGKILSDEDLTMLMQEIDINSCWNILFDLDQLHYITSVGISFFVKSMTRARIHGGEILLMNLNKKVSDLFQITKLDQIFPIVGNLQEAKIFFKEN